MGMAVPHWIRVTAAAGLAAAALSVQAQRSLAAADDGQAIEFFERRIRPVLVERCYPCHSAQADSVKADLYLDTRQGLLDGGDSGPAIKPGDPAASLLIRAIRYTDEKLRMPPEKRGGKLTAEQVADFETWVKMGAVYPLVDSSPAAASTMAMEEARRFWSFQPIREPQLPPVARSEWVQTGVDRFVLAELEKRGLTPSAPADRRTLLRRAKFDLLGLPPTWEEIDAFENDSSPEAYANLIERYLSSPHYGERWGRYWLDVARYSDTKGYVYAREERRFVHAHAYRDWVIRAFNDDMPYDQFLIRQIAADQLGEQDPSSLAAMGLLTVGRRFINVIHDIIDDRIDVVCRGTMGLTVSCARCHDHKYDPIPTQDYYSLYGVFHGSSEETVPLDKPPDSALGQAFEQELLARRKALEELFETKRGELLDRLRSMVPQYLAAVPDVERLPTVEFYMSMEADEINPVIVRQWHAYLSSTGSRHPLFAPWHAFAALPPSDFAQQAAGVMQRLADAGLPLNALVAQEFAGRPPTSMADVAQRYGRLLGEAFTNWHDALESAKAAGTEPPSGLQNPAQEALRQVLYGPESPINLPPVKPAEAEFFFAEKAREELGQAQARIDQWIVEAEGAPPYAVILEDRPVQGNPCVLVRGNPKNIGAQVPRRFLEVLAGPDRLPFQKGSGRLELARAIANPDNPLTARVMVNRIWLHHFGSGLVKTPSDFGMRSEPPSHPELLDYLAHRFTHSDWSIKNLHRLIMLSGTYQQAGEDRPDARHVDPDNRYLWRMNPRRLDFEATRDSLLAVSGQLDATVGGRAVDLTSQPYPRRRTVYGYIDRLNLPTMYRAFDFASPDAHSPQRHQTTVPQQALFMMNHPFVMEQARRLAAQPEVAAAPTLDAQVETLYRRILARSATPEEIALARPFIEGPAGRPSPEQSPPSSSWSYGCACCDGPNGGIKDFAPLPFFTGEAWHGGPQIPDLKSGWPSLTSQGGNPGRAPGAAIVRRWTAPRAGTVEVEGSISHTSDQGDGIRARIFHSRLGELASWTLHKLDTSSTIKGLKVEAGDTIDFVVDGRSDHAADAFSWAPVVRLKLAGEGVEQMPSQEWDAKRDFAGPTYPPLTPSERYVHILLQCNEFIFVD